MKTERVKDLCHSIKNRCTIAEFIIENDYMTETLLPTLLEDNFEDCQELVEFCVLDFRDE